MPQGTGYGMPAGANFLAQLGPDLGRLLMAARSNPAAVAAAMSAGGVPTPDTEEFGQLLNPTSDASEAFGGGGGFTDNLMPFAAPPAAQPQTRQVQTIPIGPQAAQPAGGPPPATPGSLPPTPVSAAPPVMADPFGGMGFDPGAVGDNILAPKANPMQQIASALMGGGTGVAKQPAGRAGLPQVQGLQKAERQPPTGGIAGAQKVPDNPVKPPPVAQLLAMLLGGAGGAKGGGGSQSLGSMLG